MPTQDQETQARALLAKGNALGAQASQQTGVAYSPIGQPAAQAPVTPVPQISTPAAPTTAPVAPQTNATPQQPAMGAQQAPALQLPVNGSVVDLLSMAGQDSSFAARQKLAQQYGIQGYQGTAAQNTELSKKFIDAFNAGKGKAAPQSGAEARTALADYFSQQQTEATQDPIPSFMDSFAAMNPIEANLYSQLSTLLSTPTNQQSFTELYAQEVASQGIPGIQLELADLNRIMNGTEDDIRDEISHSGGFATESQVQALGAARNKTLLKKAQYLSDVLASKNDYVDRIISLTGADRDQVDKDIDRKLGITSMLFDMTQKMQSNAKENYMNIVNSVGWDGLAKTLEGNPGHLEQVESLLGLAPGELQALSQYKKPVSEEDDLRLQNLRLQNAKMAQDLNTGPGISTQVIDVGGKKMLINSKTGDVIKEIAPGDSTASYQKLALAQSNISSIDSLLSDNNIKSAVGPNYLARTSPLNLFTGGKSNYIAGVEQLRQNLTLDNLVSAKANGATFGALSEGELGLLQASASKLGTWAIKDKNGNVTGYNASEKDFKQELDKINTFAKLDFILKGGNPDAAGVKQMADGTLWVKNSDGTYTQLK